MSFAGVDEPQNVIEKGQRVNVSAMDRTMTRLMAGLGWDQRAMTEDMIDMDVSVFLLNKDDQTREDDDFIFYNQESGCEGSVVHRGDNRTGAGDGDDEQIDIDLNGLPFDITKIVFVLSVYDDGTKGHHFGMVKNVFLRLVNQDGGFELVRFVVPEEDLQDGRAMVVARLLREGPEWFLEAGIIKSEGGLGQIATDYGIIIKEMQ